MTDTNTNVTNTETNNTNGAAATGTAPATEKPLAAAKPGERSIVEIVADLKKPVNQRHLSKKRQGGQELTFISWFHRVKYLDHFAPGWSSEITRMQEIGNAIVVTVRLSIPTSEGVVYREATGQEKLDTNSYGDPSSNAEAMALSRASAKFGLGLSLYEANK